MELTNLFMREEVLSLEHRPVLFITEVQPSTTTLFLSTTCRWCCALTHRGCSIVAGVNLCPSLQSCQCCTHKVTQIKHTHIHSLMGEGGGKWIL